MPVVCLLLSLFTIWYCFPGAAGASVTARSEQVTIATPLASVAGTMLLPLEGGRGPCVVLIGGTLSHTRDGEMVRDGAPKRTALKRFAEALLDAGYSSFRYDKVGYGTSNPSQEWSGSYADEARVAAEVIQYVRRRPECAQVAVAGESAGAYVASLAARDGARADAYLFLRGFCGQAEEIFEFNFGRLAEYVEGSRERREWALHSGLQRELALGQTWKDLFRAAREGKDTFEVVDGKFRLTVDLKRRKEEIALPPDEMFAHIKAPALALAGTRDLNVAPHHATCAAAVMQKTGNLRARSVLIDGADHNFQIAPDDQDRGYRERHTFASFNRPYHPGLDTEVLRWLGEVLPMEASHDHDHPHAHPHIESAAATSTAYDHAVEGSEVEPKTPDSPERFHLAPGLTIIDDVTDLQKTVSVETLEGRIGPLLRTSESRAHFIDMPAGMYLDEHPHAKGNIIYTVRGEWALKSAGRWHHMKPGTLYWFGDNIPTGFQVPFRQDAYILIFKAISGDEDKVFMDYLRGMAEQLEKQREQGTPFALKQLPYDHPARQFARQINPRFEEEFGQ